MLTRSKSLDRAFSVVDLGKKIENPVKKNVSGAKTCPIKSIEETAVKALSPEKPGPSGLNSGAPSNLLPIQEVSSVSVTVPEASNPTPARPATDGVNSTESPAIAGAGNSSTTELAPGAQAETRFMEACTSTKVREPTGLSKSDLSDIENIWKDVPSLAELESLLGIESEADRVLKIGQAVTSKSKNSILAMFQYYRNITTKLLKQLNRRTR